MKNVINNFLIIILAFGMTIFSCSKDNNDPSTSDPELDDTTIAIDDEQAFNMKNFAASFEQLFVPKDYWMWNFTHEIVDGKATETYQNLKIHGEFGDKIFTIVHEFNTDGIITSSVRSTNEEFEDEEIKFTYVYDLDGYIVKMNKYEVDDGDLEDIIELMYNDQHQLIKKTHPSQMGSTVKVEEFKYNSDGKLIEWEVTRDGSFYKRIEFTYSGDNVIKRAYIRVNSDNERTYEYNSDNLLVKQTRNNEDYYTFEYTTDRLIITEFNERNGQYLIDDIEEYGVGYILMKEWDYRYDDGVLEYCKTKEKDDKGYTKKKEYFEGTMENLDLVGYSIIDSREELKENKKTKESIFNASGTRLYYAEFVLVERGYDDWDIENTNWFKDDGTAIAIDDIDEKWVFKLVR